MDQSTFDTFARRAAHLLDRRSLLGGLSAALPALVGLPVATEAKKKGKKKRNRNCKKEKKCKNFFFSECDRFPEIPNCKSKVRNCCEKICESENKANECLDNIPA
jgi:hypothetical protein